MAVPYYQNYQLPAQPPTLTAAMRRRRRYATYGGAGIGAAAAGGWLLRKRRKAAAATVGVEPQRIRRGFLGPQVVSREQLMKERAEKARYKISRTGRRERGARVQELWKNRQLVKGKGAWKPRKLKRGSFRMGRLRRFGIRHATGINRLARILSVIR